MTIKSSIIKKLSKEYNKKTSDYNKWIDEQKKIKEKETGDKEK